MQPLRNERTGALVANTRVARTPWERTVGFIGRAEVRDDEGMWFDHCDAIHMLGMRVPLDVVFLDDELRVLRVEANLRPFRLARCAGARSVLELRGGRASELGLRAGDRLRFS